jgi:ATP-dependent helicase HrpA
LNLKPELKIDFPENLPVSERREDIMAAMQAHQVIIVCGETGSGKTTQLPKMALALGRGSWANGPKQWGSDPHLTSANSPSQLGSEPAKLGSDPDFAEQNSGSDPNFASSSAKSKRRQIIGHTQPRRIAATSVAKRIADELKTPLGEVVGYKVRFQDKLSRDASVKLMTDGILLAETQTDPLLLAYDTLIIDEAHERSLNIDFLLGYLRQILPRRPDLKIIVTSATIDADRFAQHFASAKGPAPVLMVSGRTFPVEMRYRPWEESREHDLGNAIADAVDELWTGAPRGDILVFLPGEREIRDAADHLRGHLAHNAYTRHVEVLPLFARLSQAEQERVFETGGAPRIVLATNVAETSLTVPGIRYVVDAGMARVKRYSFRSKVEQLLVEPISQAAANQRAGRCGRVADGICIRLYDEKDFNGRPRFTEPEILRSSLAGVILRMMSLRLGDVADFPFLEAPRPKAISDGFQLLNELGAVTEDHSLTPIGHELSKLPLDPRVGRMILAAREQQSLHEVLIIASALSVQDVRDRPLQAQTQADQAHAKFKDDKSEFSGYLRLWDWLQGSRGGESAAAQPEAGAGPAKKGIASASATGATHKLSNRQHDNLLRQNFINIRRWREWRDVHSQLLTVVKEQRWTLNDKPASYEQLHLSMLSGLLGNIGWKQDEEDIYLGARGIKFHRHPGVHLRKKPGKWLVCAELVETTRLFGRGIANIEPTWLEQVGAHLLKKQLLDPHWEARHGDVVAFERATLYGLVVYSGRRVPYAKADPVLARQIFIREALVEAQWQTPLAFMAANKKLIAQVMELEHKSRRQDVLVDEAMIQAFYEQHLPEDVCSCKTLERWHRDESRRRSAAGDQTEPLLMTREALMRHEAVGITAQAFPKMVRLGGVDCAAQYLHAPGDSKDGLTVTVPLFVLNQVSDDRAEWLVPGMLKDKIQALLKSLPQRPRSRFVPLPESAARLAQALSAPEVFGAGGLTDVLLKKARDETSLDIKRTDFKLDMLSAHFFMNFKVVDEHGRQLGQGRNLGALKAELGAQARGAFQALAGLKVKSLADEKLEELGSDPDLQPQKTGFSKLGSGVKLGSEPEFCFAKSGSDPNFNQASKAGSDPNFAKSAKAQNSGKSSGADQRNLGSDPDFAKQNSGSDPNFKTKPSSTPNLSNQRHTTWSFGELPELMEISKGGQSLIGFPALVDLGDAVSIEVFDEPDLAATKHRAGLRRLFALQIKDALKYLEKNIPDLQKMTVAYMLVGKTPEGAGGGTSEELKQQILDVALERAFLLEPLPNDEASFKRRVDEGRGRLTLIANEVARLAGGILLEFGAAARKIKDTKNAPDATADCAQQLQRLMPKHFMAATPWPQLQHYGRYLKAITLRLDKYRADPSRDAQRLTELKPLEQKYWRLVAERKGQTDARMLEFRWLLEELRVSFFAQELRTPQPVSIKRLEKAWAQLSQ